MVVSMSIFVLSPTQPLLKNQKRVDKKPKKLFPFIKGEMMVNRANADLSETKMEGEETVRTIDCLRGRLLAERLVSKNAKDEADKLENKLNELENLLKEEEKSRNRAEKRLKYLMKKLESKSKNTSCTVSDVSEHSGLVDRSDITSVSSIASSVTKESDEKSPNPQIEVSSVSQGLEGSKEEANLSKCTLHLMSDCSQIGLSSPNRGSSTSEENCSEVGSNDATPLAPTGSDNSLENVAKSTAVEVEEPCSVESSSNQNLNDSKTDGQDEMSGECDQGEGYQADNSMALVLVETQQENQQRIDPEVLDASVKEVLDALRHAKEQLQSSMERRRMNMIRVG